MPDDPVRVYLDARKALEQAARRAEDVAKVVTDAGNKLRDWRNVIVSDVNVGFPPELLGGPSIGARQWPTAQEIAEALGGWHNAFHAARSAWRAVPPPDRAGLQPPDR